MQIWHLENVRQGDFIICNKLLTTDTLKISILTRHVETDL